MAISKDDVQLCICKFMKYSFNSCWDFAKDYPLVSFTLLLFSFLYACFSWFFWALMHLLAFLILVFSITRIYSTTPQTKKSPVNNNNSNTGTVDTSKQYVHNVKNGKTFVRVHSVRQRKSGETSRTSPLQSSDDEKIAVSSSNFNNDIIDKSPLAEETPKEIGEVKDCNISLQESQKFVSGGEIESESSEEDEKETAEKIHKAVQWTEDDEKNLMDLGYSEIERNKRLESLIAKRSAKKMLSLQIRRTVNTDTSHIAPIAIPNNNMTYSPDQLSPTPGSAPSVMLPAFDPFDLPHDLQEEPVLAGGIAPVPKNNGVFCRHVSFSLGNPRPMEFRKEEQETNPLPDDLENFDTGNQLEGQDTDKIIEIESCQSPKYNMKNIEADDCITDEIQNLEKGKVSDDVHEVSDDVHEVSDDVREEHQNNNVETKHVVIHHNSTNSFASDLQVEVSEVGDGSISSLDIGSLIEEEDVTSESTNGNEAPWEIPFQPSRNDDADSKLKEMHKLHEESPMILGFSRNEESKDIIVPHEPANNIKEQDFTDSLLRPASMDELSNSSQEHIPDFLMEVNENFQKPDLQSSTSDASAFPVFEDVQQSTENQMPQHIQTLESGIRETDAEVDPLNKKGGAEPGEMAQISTSTSFGLNESQQEETENHPNIPDPRNKQIDENDASKVPTDTQSESQKQELMDEPMSIEDRNTAESTQVNDGGEHTNEDRFSGLHVSFSHQALVLHPTPVPQEVSMSSEISSPRSVLQPKLSTDRSTLSNTTEDMHAEIQQMYTQMVENNVPEEERATLASPPNATVLRENSTSPSFLDGLEAKVSQESSHPSSSAVEDNSLHLESKSAVAGNETREIPECTTENINNPIALVDLQKLVEEINPSTMGEINNSSDEHYKHEVSPTLANPNEQLNEESSHLSKPAMEVNSPKSSSAVEDERREDKAMEIPDSTAIRTSNENMTVSPQKLIEEETNPSTLDNNIIPQNS